MGYRKAIFAPESAFHIFTRGVERRDIFLDDKDKVRFIDLLHHCLPVGDILSFSIARRLKYESVKITTGKGLVDILGYCLMPNHFHLLLKENTEGGISKYMQRLLNSYARYFNVKYERQGSLFVGPFRAVGIENNDQLLHTSRYIHLNPYAASMTKNIFQYPWSSLSEYMGKKSSQGICHTELIRGMLSPIKHREFMLDHADYLDSLQEYDDVLID